MAFTVSSMGSTSSGTESRLPRSRWASRKSRAIKVPDLPTPAEQWTMRGFVVLVVDESNTASKGKDEDVVMADGEFKVADLLMRLSMAVRLWPSGTEKSGQPTNSK